MAKGNAMGVWKGKKGSSVFYKIWNSNNKEKQGIREYQPNVSNPQTDIQVDQRMKMLPAQLIKGALRDIVSRSFQGVPYGSKSRLEFMKYALRAEITPYLPKGWTDPVPGTYLISRGTLPQIGLRYTSDIPGFLTSIEFNIDIENNTTIGTFSNEILEKNPQFQQGDQITFVTCNYWSQYLNKFEWVYFSVILDPTNEELFNTLRGFSRFVIGRDSQHLYISGIADNGCAAGVIHSRLSSDGQYLRSNCEITLDRTGDNEELASYFTPAAAGVARASYKRSTGTRAEDWPVQEEADTQTGGAIIDGAYTLTGLTGDKAVLNGRDVYVKVYEDTGVLAAVYSLRGYPVGNAALINANTKLGMYYTSGGVETVLMQSDVTGLAGLPTIEYTPNNNDRLITEPEAKPEPEPAAEKKTARAKK